MKTDERLVWAVVALALLAVGVPRLITVAPLDLLSEVGNPAVSAEDPEANFPGSAFFFVQGLFDRLPSHADKSKHVLALGKADPAPAEAFRGRTALDRYRALNCLTSAIYYEAGDEPEEGQRAVAQVVLNRVRSPFWPNNVCGVVYQGSERTDSRCQFTFSCDGSMARVSHAQAWARARRIAEQALAGRVYAPVGLATFYHTLTVRPGWAASKQPVAIVGAHIFYRVPGPRGARAAFRIAYAGREWQSGPASRPWISAPHSAVRAMSEPLSPPSALSPSGEPQLPQSTIKAEYRNTGRPLI